MTLTGEMTSRRLIYWQSCQFVTCSTTSHRARAKFLRTAISLHIEVLFLDLPGCVSDCRVNRPGVQISDSHGRLLFGSGSSHSQFDRRGVLLHFRSVARVVTVRCDCRSFSPDESGRVGGMAEQLGNEGIGGSCTRAAGRTLDTRQDHRAMVGRSSVKSLSWPPDVMVTWPAYTTFAPITGASEPGR